MQRIEEAEHFQHVLAETFLPNRIVVATAEGNGLTALEAKVPLTKTKRALGGEATAYVCEKRVCKRPTCDAEEVRRQLLGLYGEDDLYEGGLSVRTTLEPALQELRETDPSMKVKSAALNALAALEGAAGGGATPKDS